MTAINVLVQPDAVHLLTDGTVYDDAGIVQQIGSKVVYSERIKLALTTSGRTDARLLLPWLEQFAGLREARAAQQNVLAALPGVMWELRERNRNERPDLEHENDFQVFVALWSIEHDQPEALLLSTEREYVGGSYEPFSFAPVNRVNTPHMAMAWNDVERDGLAIIEAQRRFAWPNGLHYVGGFAELTTVMAAGVTQRRLIEWPDRVGEMIIPGQ